MCPLATPVMWKAGEENQWAISPSPHIHIHLFSGHHAQGPCKQRFIVRKLGHTHCKFYYHRITILPLAHVRTAQ